MRKTIPQYTIFTCDCCGREQDDRKYQESRTIYDVGLDVCGVRSYPFSLCYPYNDKPLEIEVCLECAQRLQEAVEGVKARASAENVQEQLAMIERRAV